MHKNHTGWIFLVGVILFAGACSDDVPESEPGPQAKTAAKQPDLPVREWYPTPKHARPRMAMPPAQPPARMPLTQRSSSSPVTAPVPQQQQWYVQPWPAPVQQPVAPQQYGYGYSYETRPWGNVPDSKSRKQAGTAQNSWSQGTGYQGAPAYGSGQYYVYPAPGTPGYVW